MAFAAYRRIVLVIAMSFAIAAGDIAAEMMSAQPQEHVWVAVESLVVPDGIDVGDAVWVEVYSAFADGIAEVRVQGAYGQLRFEVPVVNGEGRLRLPVAVTQHAGVVTIESGGRTETVQILPGEVSTLVAPLVGPRTIVANGADQTLAVLLPTDRFGNQVADGTETTIFWNQPSNLDSATRAVTTDGMTWALVSSGEVAGPTMVRATAEGSGTVRAASVRIDEVPGTVRTIEARASASTGLADGRSIIAVQTGELVDAFDNPLADGTIAQFTYNGPTGRGVVNGTVQNGAVHIELSAPTSPGRLAGQFEIHGTTSNEIAIDYATAITGFDVRLDVIGTEAVLRVYNALDPAGAFVADGTELTWGDQRVPLRRGSAEIWVPAALVDAAATAEILGLIQPVQEGP